MTLLSPCRRFKRHVRSARGDDDSGLHEPDQAAIDRAIAHMEMLMTTEDLH